MTLMHLANAARIRAATSTQCRTLASSVLLTNPNYAKMNKNELVNAAKERGLPRSGSKATLIQRLQESDRSNLSAPFSSTSQTSSAAAAPSPTSNAIVNDNTEGAEPSATSKLSQDELSYPPYEGKNIAFEAPKIIGDVKAVPGNVVIPQMPDVHHVHTVPIPLLPGKESPDFDEGSAFVMHAPRVSSPRRSYNIISGLSRENSDMLGPEDPASAPGVPVKNSSSPSQDSTSVLGSLFNSYLGQNSVKKNSGLANAWTEDWKFDDRPLSANERKGLWVLGSILAGGWLIGGTIN